MDSAETSVVEEREPARIADPRSVTAAPRPSILDPRRSVLLPAVLSGGMLWAAHFPLAWGWLGWVALVPILSLVRRDLPAWRVFLGSWLTGVLFFAPALQWLRLADPRNYYSWPGLVLYCSFYLPLGIGLVRLLVRRAGWPLLLALPVVWTALEYLRAHLFTGFPWYFLAHTQHDFLLVIQIADVTGAYGVTFVVALVNAVLFELACTRAWFRRGFGMTDFTPACGLARRAVISFACLALVLGYGVVRLTQSEFELGPRVALIQGNLEQHIRNAASGVVQTQVEDPATVMLKHFQALHDSASKLQPKPDLIVWPETSHPDGWLDRGYEVAAEPLPAFQKTYNAAVHRLVQQAGTDVLFGLNTEVMLPNDKRRLYNSAVLLRPKAALAERYDKIHRVPFGEYVPLRESFAFMNRLAPYDFDYSISAGEGLPRFQLGDHRFGVVICYEDSDPTLARQYVTGEQPVDFLVNISNDGWFRGSSEHEEHLAICRFRAVECRRAVTRAVNMGISALIDGNGRVLAAEPLADDNDRLLWQIEPLTNFNIDRYDPNSTWAFLYEARAWYALNVAKFSPWQDLPKRQWHEFKKVGGVLVGQVPLDRRTSLYARWGDWLPIACWGVLGLSMGRSVVRRVAGRRSGEAHA
ncbi:MAG: apolipoprotein N-acyltransferase [Planctomycetia bacterium]|nr:apolipoprotein N-acyltransferase [Planctomycetia bacterium]